MRAGRGIAAAVVLVAIGGAAFAGFRLMSGSEAPPTAALVSPSSTTSPSPEPVVTLAWGPTEDDWEAALEVAAALSLEEAAGQVLVAEWASPDASGAASLVSSYHLGGVILTPGAIVDATQITALTTAVTDAAAAEGRTWPAIVSVDQEGGPVARLTGIIPDLPAFMASGSARDKQTVTEAHAHMAAAMAALGFTVDWAPVADVTIGLADPVIRVRSAGSDPANVTATVIAAMDGLEEGGVVPAIKHFPGVGSVTTDPHAGLPVQSATVVQLEQRDFVPFRDAIAAGAPVVMMSHVVVPEWGPGASTVTPAAYAYLREQLGFTGVVVTDALNMEAITATYGPGDAAVASLAAGADLLLMPVDVAAAHAAIVAAVQSGTLGRDRLDEAAARSILLMTWQSQMVPTVTQADPRIAIAFAATSASVSAADCTALVGGSVSISGGYESERNALAAALAEYGISTGGGTSIRLIGAPDGSANADVVVAMDGPWGLPVSGATAYVGLYGRSDEAFAGLAAVLAGATPPSGSWPIDVAGIPYSACGA